MLLYNKNIHLYVKDILLVQDFDETEFAGTLLENDTSQAESAGEILYGLESLMAKYLINPDYETGQEFLDALKKSAVSYYRTDMQDLVDEARTEDLLAEYEDNNMICSHDRVNGEPIWRLR